MLGTIIVGAILTFIVALAALKVYKDRKSGKSCGCDGCNGCSLAGECSAATENDNDKSK